MTMSIEFCDMLKMIKKGKRQSLLLVQRPENYEQIDRSLMCARLAETNALYKACGELQQDEIGICRFTFTEIL